MRKTRRHAIFIMGLALTAIWPVSRLDAGITNGNFDLDGDGLSGWSLDPGDTTQVRTEGGYAQLREEEGESEPFRLYQVFNIDAGDDTIVFDLKIDGAPSGGETDYFNAYLYPGSWDGTAGHETDIFCDWTSSEGPLPLTEVRRDIPWHSGQACLIFELQPDGDGGSGSLFTIVNLGNIRTASHTGAVPAPPAMIIAGIGASLVMGYFRRMAKKQ